MIIELWHVDKGTFYLIELKEDLGQPEQWMDRNGKFIYPNETEEDLVDNFAFKSRREAISVLKNRFDSVYEISYKRVYKEIERGSRLYKYYKCK